jgi:putative DNA primase/helicase
MKKKRDQLTDGERCLRAALDYLDRGWSVLALCSPDHDGFQGDWHRCGSPGKRPWHGWKHHQDRLPTVLEVQDRWVRHPNSNVGITLGPVSGLVRGDVDGPEAVKALRHLSKGDLPKTLKFTGGRTDSYGLLFAIPEGVELRTTPKPVELASGELRFQAKGAQTVLPPSRHPSGRLYRWAKGCSPDDIEPAPMPDWLVKAMRPDRRPTTTPRRGTRTPTIGGGPIPSGQRNSALTSLAGKFRRKGYDESVIAANLLAANAARCVPPLDESEVRAIARSVARYTPGVVVSESKKENGVHVVVRNANRPGHYIIHARVEVEP